MQINDELMENEFADKDLLQYALAQGILDLGSLRDDMDQKLRKKYLAMHEGRIWQGSNGSWYALIPATADKKRRLVKKKYKEDLEEELIAYYKANEETRTFRDMFNEWRDAKFNWNEIGRTTYDRYTGEFHRFFDGTSLPGKRVDLITDDYLDEFIRTRISTLKLSAKAYGNMKTLISGPLKYAKKRHFTEFSAGTFFSDFVVSQKAFAKHEKKRQVFRKGEVETLSQWLWHHPKIENFAILLAFETGLRQAELVALKFSDVDGDFLTIRRQQIRYKSETNKGKMDKVIVDYTKTEAGNRQVVLTPNALKIIEQLKIYSDSGVYMFYKNDHVIDKVRLNEYLKRACNNVGIQPLSMHKIRKTYGTRLLDGGADDSTVQAQMGHTDVATTRKCYYDSDKEKEEVIKQVRTAIAGA